MTVETLTTFLGWCTILNLILLSLATLSVIAFRGFMVTIHSSLLGVEEDQLAKIYVQYLSAYKILFLIFNLVPYLALKIMMG